MSEVGMLPWQTSTTKTATEDLSSNYAQLLASNCIILPSSIAFNSPWLPLSSPKCKKWIHQIWHAGLYLQNQIIQPLQWGTWLHHTLFASCSSFKLIPIKTRFINTVNPQWSVNHMPCFCRCVSTSSQPDYHCPRLSARKRYIKIWHAASSCKTKLFTLYNGVHDSITHSLLHVLRSN